MKKTFLFIIALIAVVTSCEHVTYDTFCAISGTVIDLQTGDPVQPPTVTITPIGYNTYTGSDGYFEFLDLDVKTYTLQVQKTGYVTNRKEVTPVAGAVANINLTLQKRN